MPEQHVGAIEMTPRAWQALAALQWVTGQRLPHTHEDATAFGDFVRQRLAQLGVTRDEFADRLHVDRSTIYRLLGHAPPQTIDTQRLVDMAAVLDTPAPMLVVLWRGHLGEFGRQQRDRMFTELHVKCLGLSPDQAYEVLTAAYELASAFDAS